MLNSATALNHSNVSRWIVASNTSATMSSNIPLNVVSQTSRIGKLTFNYSVLVNEIETIVTQSAASTVVAIDGQNYRIANAALILAIILCVIGLGASLFFSSSGLSVLFPIGLAIWLVTGHWMSRADKNG